MPALNAVIWPVKIITLINLSINLVLWTYLLNEIDTIYYVRRCFIALQYSCYKNFFKRQLVEEAVASENGQIVTLKSVQCHPATTYIFNF